MRANFNLEREIENELVCGHVHSPNVVLHFHSQTEIYFVRSGEIEIIINDKRKILREGEISVAFGYDAHGYRTLNEAEAIYLIIPSDCYGEFLPLFAGKHLHSPFLDDREMSLTVRSAMEGIIAGGNEVSKRGHIYAILGAILDKMSAEAHDGAATHGFSAEILIYMSKHFKEELTSVAREFGYSPSYLSRMFMDTFGMSFVKYITMLRLREAVLLLRSGKMSATYCAMESGFGSMRSFYRAFHEEFGCNPTEYFNTAKH